MLSDQIEKGANAGNPAHRIAFGKELVVLAIGDDRRGVDVVATVVGADFLAEAGDLLFDGFGHEAYSTAGRAG